MFRIENVVPSLFMVIMVVVVAVVNYALPSGPWVFAVFLDKNIDAFAVSAAHAEAVVQSSAEHNAVTLRVTDPSERQSLLEQGAILLDPEGVPLCLQNF